MPYVTTLTLRSGDRVTLDEVVEDLRRTAEQKGIELKGPHTHPPETYRVPLYRRPATASGEFPPWTYTVYERVLSLGGHDASVRRLADRDFPDGVFVSLEIEQVHQSSS